MLETANRISDPRDPKMEEGFRWAGRMLSSFRENVFRFVGRHGRLWAAPLMFGLVFCYAWFTSADHGALLAHIIKQATPLALVALGAGLVIATGGVDIGFIGIATICGMAYAFLTHLVGLESHGFGLIYGLAFCALVGGGLGLLNGLAISTFRAPPLITTWATGTIWLIASVGLAMLASRGYGVNASYFPTIKSVSLFSRPPNEFWVIDGFLFGQGIWLCLSLVVLIPFLFHFSNLGNMVRAVGAHRLGATFIGIRVRRVEKWAYTVSGCLAGSAGLLLTLLVKEASTTDYVGIELSVIAVAVLGGTVMTGGYFSSVPVGFAAFFWATTLHILNSSRVLPEGILSQKGVDAIFAGLLILIGLALGRRISGEGQTIIVVNKDQENIQE
jgi:ribose transport system permease protein